MTYTLLFWIGGCVGPSCAIADFEWRYFDSQTDCQEVQRLWHVASPRNVAICVKGKLAFDDYAQPIWQAS